MADPKNFLVDSDYPLDKIIYIVSGSYSQAGSGGTGTQVTVAHGLSFRPLVTGNWSTTSDFSVSSELFFPVYTDNFSTYVQVFSNDTDITISGFKQTAGYQTIYYRIYGFMPSDVNLDVSYTASLADKFQLNTDYNYTKLYLSNIATASATTTITHNFGYRPQVIAWSKNISAYGTGIVNIDISSYVLVTNTTVVIKSATKDVHYRIYADGQL